MLQIMRNKAYTIHYKYIINIQYIYIIYMINIFNVQIDFLIDNLWIIQILKFERF